MCGFFPGGRFTLAKTGGEVSGYPFNASSSRSMSNDCE